MQTIDIMILAAVAAMLFLALRSTLRHYSGKGGGCCGCSGCSGGSSSCHQEKPGKIVDGGNGLTEEITGSVFTRTLQIHGMHCSACKQSVESALAGINGVICADVNLKTGTAKVVLRGEVEDSYLKETVENKGFEVKEIRMAGV